MTMKEVLGPEKWDEDMDAAWTDVYMHISEVQYVKARRGATMFTNTNPFFPFSFPYGEQSVTDL